MKGLTFSLCLILISALTRAEICPDGFSCNSDETCCLISSGHYGCCPMPNAVCCDDMEHCCPEGYTCIDALCYLETPTPMNSSAETTCPGGKFSCPDGDTCCPVGSAFTCCPLPNASCCSDGAHCCPEGTTCDLAHQTCNVPALDKKAKVIDPSPNDVICPGGKYKCPDGNTCCLIEPGEYGCCPILSAVCCKDGIHCCPAGYSCSDSGCTAENALPIPTEKPQIIKKVTISEGRKSSEGVLETKNTLNDVVCPGGEAQCPDGNTCCLLKSGDYGCCPIPNAVCCTDGIHCCPPGYNCSDSGCTKEEISTKFSKKPQITKQITLSEARKLSASLITSFIDSDDVVCPGGEYQCPDGNTCCILPSGDFGCCPLPNAVCCDDHLHCCPSGYSCSEGECFPVVKAPARTDRARIIQEIPIKKTKQNHEEFLNSTVVCPDGHSQCPNGNTCCMLNTGTYGCCPYALATCCLDHIHCCPHGTLCLPYGRCSTITESSEKPLVVPWERKIPALPRRNHEEGRNNR